MLNIAMLGTGFIAKFYADSLLSNRRRDKVTSVYSRTQENALRFASEYGATYSTNSMKAAVSREDVDIVCIALPNFLHEKAVMVCVEAGKAIMVTKPLGRNAEEALRMLNAVEDANIFHGYLEDLVYSPKTLKALESVNQGAIGRVLWAKSREAHSGPHSDWFWDKEKSGGGAMLDLGCHCIEIARNYIGKDVKPLEVFCWAETQVKPIEAEDHAIGLVKYANGAVGQFEVSWTFRGGMDLRDEVMGSDGTIWVNNFLRTGLEMFSVGGNAGYVAEKVENNTGWLFPVGDEVNELGYNHMFSDILNSFERGGNPKEDLYDGYIVNAILDAAYKSSESKRWERIVLPIWRGKEEIQAESNLIDYDKDYFFIKEERTHYGTTNLILKSKTTGEIVIKKK